jgi:hypothetical protein
MLFGALVSIVGLQGESGMTDVWSLNESECFEGCVGRVRQRVVGSGLCVTPPSSRADAERALGELTRLACCVRYLVE